MTQDVLPTQGIFTEQAGLDSAAMFAILIGAMIAAGGGLGGGGVFVPIYILILSYPPKFAVALSQATNTPSSTPTNNPTNAPTTKAPTTYAPTTGELGITDKPSKSPSNVTDVALSFESIGFNEMITNDTILIVMILIFIVGALLGGIIALVACMCWKKKAKRKDTQLNMAEMVKMDSVQSAGNTTNVNAEMNVNVIAAPFANIVNGMVEDEMRHIP
eukprot:UN09125